MRSYQHPLMIVGISILLCLFVSAALNAATTGKIAGKIVDKTTGQPLAGANILVEGTMYGAAADLNGDYYIINVPPGRYNVNATMMGYATVRMEEVKISVNSTTNLTFELSQEVLEGEVVTVTASAISFKKDQTSSVRNVSSDQMEVLPIENMEDVVQMQAGVVEGHFRGGRSNEVSYLIDGLQVDDAFSGEGRTVTVESDVIEDLEVITGTFNAEYGRAMSGIVNAVTKDGGRGLHGRFSGSIGNYYTGHDVYIGLKASEITRNQDYKLQLEGPIWGNKLTFFSNVRYQNNLNHLNGVRRFIPSDYSNYTADDPALWIDTHNGDSSYVPMNDNKALSFFGKVTFRPIPTLKTFLIYSRNDGEWGSYGHTWKYNPDGRARGYSESDMFSFQVNHSIGRSMFYELKLSSLESYHGNYLYKNPLNPNYIHDMYAQSFGPGFLTGGQNKGHTERWQKDLTGKFDLTWQVNNNHSLKVGALAIQHEIDHNWHAIRNKYYSDPDVYLNYYDPEKNTYVYPVYEPVLFPDSTIYAEEYLVEPIEFAGYLQDKMEFNEMVINLGVRYDYFDPNTTHPSNLRNPANQLLFENNPEKMSTYPQADPKYQISPRFGLSYQLSNAALLHFSYGHFFQAPPMYAFYQNHSLLIQPTDYNTENGNPQLNAQKTVQYEIGLWQELMTGMGIEVNLFYRDIYDLLSMKIVSTYNQIQYGLYTNKDYGNVKGLEVKYDFNMGPIAAYLNYTLQYTRGNADNPRTMFTRAGSAMDPITRLIPMSWDQRHTVNLTVSYNKKQYGATLTGYYNSGAPYTWSPIAESRLSRVLLYPNNSIKPANSRFDLYGFYDIPLRSKFKLRLTLLVENLLDQKAEYGVNGNTGRANEAIIREIDLAQHRSTFNAYEDRINNPASFGAPRYVKLGVGVVF